MIVKFAADIQIEGHPVTVSYAHQNSFAPIYVASPWATSTCYDATGNIVYVLYWDNQAFTVPFTLYKTTEQVENLTEKQPLDTLSGVVSSASPTLYSAGTVTIS